MTRALMWKEFREQRPLILAALIIVLVLPLFLIGGLWFGASRSNIASLSGTLTTIVLLLVWPLFALAVGAQTIGSETIDGSLRFLLSRPVSRTRVWLVKLGVAVATLGVIVLGTGIVTVMYEKFVVLRSYRADDVSGWLQPDRALPVAMALLALLVSAHYCSLFLRRPLAAAIAGLVAAGSMAVGVNIAWGMAGAISNFNAAGAAFHTTAVFTAVPLATVGVLALAYRVFRRGELGGERALRRLAAPLVVVAMVVVLVAAVPGTYAAVRWEASVASGQLGTPRVAGDAMVTPRITADGFGTEIVRHDLSGGEGKVIASSRATLPALSPNGEWVAYVAYDGFLSRSQGNAHLRAVRSDGSDDQSNLRSRVGLGSVRILQHAPYRIRQRPCRVWAARPTAGGGEDLGRSR